MNVYFGSWIELTIPKYHMADHLVCNFVRDATEQFGGCTAIEGMGMYVRKDTGELQREPVVLLRWDFCSGEPKSNMGIARTRKIVDRLLDLGEECVLRRAHHGDARYPMHSELIFHKLGMHG